MPRYILITGAANGLGKALTEIFSGKGDIVFAADIDPTVMETYRERKNIFPFIMDVADDESIQKALQKIDSKAGKVDVLINNAGTTGFFPLLEASENRIQKIFQANTFGPYRVTRAFFPLLIEAKGKVINISSESVKFPTLFQPYPASKIAMEALMRSVGQELYLKGVQTTFIRPGAIDTRMHEILHSLEKEKEHSRFKIEYDNFIKKGPKREGGPADPVKVAQKIYRIAIKRG